MGVEQEGFNDLRILLLLFVDDVFPFVSLCCDFQLALERFSAKCKAAMDEDQHL